MYFEHEREPAGEGQRGRQKPEQVHTVSAEPNTGFEFTNCEMMTCAEIKS